MGLADRIRKLRRQQAERDLFAELEHQFDVLPAGGSWADEQPDPSDTDEPGRGECAA